jgi:hypothetical protein
MKHRLKNVVNVKNSYLIISVSLYFQSIVSPYLTLFFIHFLIMLLNLFIVVIHFGFEFLIQFILIFFTFYIDFFYFVSQMTYFCF